jgi:hypothetical protein
LAGPGREAYVRPEDRIEMLAWIQAFDYLGQGLALRGDPFEWHEDQEGRSPHLTREADSGDPGRVRSGAGQPAQAGGDPQVVPVLGQ